MKWTRRLSAGVAVAALVLSAGCGSKDADKAKETVKDETAKVTSKVKAAAAVVVKPLKAPPNVLAYGGTNNTEAAVKALLKMAKKVVPQVPPLDDMAVSSFQGAFRFTNAKGIDLKKPLRFVILNPKVFGRSHALLLGMTDAKTFAAALPSNEKKENDAGNAWSYRKFEGAKKPVYINFVDGYAVITRHKDIFSKHKEFFTTLGKAEMPATGAVFVELTHTLAVYGAQFDKQLSQMSSMMNMAGQSAQKSQMETVQAMLTWFKGAAREAERLTASLTLEDGIQLNLHLTAKAGSGLAKMMANLEGTGDTGLLKRLPANAPFFFAAAMQPKKLKGSLGALTAMAIKPMFGGDAAKEKAYVATMEEYLDGMTGQIVMGAHATARGLDLLAAFGIKDAVKIQAAQDKIMAFNQDPSTADYYKKMGIKQDIKKNAYSVENTPVMVVRTTLENMPAEARAMMGMMGDFMVQHLAFSKNIGVMAYGEKGKEGITGLLSGKFNGLDQAEGVKRAIADAPKNFFGLIYLNPIELAKALKLGGMNPLAAALSEVNAKSGVGFGMAINNGGLDFKISVPLQTVIEGMTAFEKTKGSF